METTNIKSIDIKDFKNNEEIIDYVDEDIVIINNLEKIPQSNDAVRLECFLIVICLEGYIRFDVNNNTYEMKPDDMFLCPPNSILEHTMLSPTHKLKFLVFSRSFLGQIVKVERKIWDIATRLYNNPVIHTNETWKNNMVFRLYKDLLVSKLNDTPHYYHKDVIHHLFAALFCEMIGYVEQQLPEVQPEKNQGHIRQSDHILRKFAELLSKDNGQHRSVSYFAGLMCYSPKHLSKTIKERCGRTPLELINESVMERIKYRLKRSDKSIKEIAEEFNFPNQSFFGKYVKAYTGMSPAQFRKQATE